MSEYVTATIHPDNGAALYRHLAVFAFSGFVRDGLGVVALHETQFARGADGIEATVVYVPWSAEGSVLPPAATELVQEYRPRRGLLLAMVSRDQTATITTLTATQLGSTPESLYRATIQRATGVAFLPAAVLRMRERIAEHEPGYVLLDRVVGAEMLFHRADQDEDGDIVATGEEFRAHVDFVGAFEDTGISMLEDA